MLCTYILIKYYYYHRAYYNNNIVARRHEKKNKNNECIYNNIRFYDTRNINIVFAVPVQGGSVFRVHATWRGREKTRRESDDAVSPPSPLGVVKNNKIK